MIGRRLARVGSCATVLGALVFAAAGARAEGRRDGGGGGGGGGGRPGGGMERGGGFRPGGMMMRPGAGREGGQATPIATAKGKLYIVVKGEEGACKLLQLSAATLEEIASAEIPVAVDAEIEKRARDAFLKRFDRNGDGAIGEDEAPSPEMLKRFDKDGDGKITAAEAPLPPNITRPSGPVTLHVDGGSVYVYRGGWLYRFKVDDLTLAAKVELEKPAEQGHGRAPFGGRGDGRRGGGGFGGRGGGGRPAGGGGGGGMRPDGGAPVF